MLWIEGRSSPDFISTLSTFPYRLNSLSKSGCRASYSKFPQKIGFILPEEKSEKKNTTFNTSLTQYKHNIKKKHSKATSEFKKPHFYPSPRKLFETNLNSKEHIERSTTSMHIPFQNKTKSSKLFFGCELQAAVDGVPAVGDRLTQCGFAGEAESERQVP